MHASIYHALLPATLVTITVIRPHFAPLGLIILLATEWLFTRAPLAPAKIAAAFGIPARIVFAFGAFAAFSAIWSPVPLHSLQVGVTLFATCAGAFLVPWLIARSPEAGITRLRYGMLAGYTIGTGLIAFEYHAGFPITKTVVTTFPALTDPSKGTLFMTWVGGELVIHPGFFTRSMFVLSVFAWPVLHLARNRTAGRRRMIYTAAPLLFLALTVPFSGKTTALLSLAASGVVFLIAFAWPKPGRRLLIAAWTAAALLAPLAGFGDRLPEDVMARLPGSVESRLILWGRVANATLQTPLLGIGADATRVVEKSRVAKLPDPGRELLWYERADRPWLARRHPHNSFLQVWYELGAVGAALLFAAGIALLVAVGRLPSPAQPFACATLTVAIVYASLEHSLWQPWFAATFALAFVLFRMAGATGRPDTLSKTA